jgi:hypothetical protein
MEEATLIKDLLLDSILIYEGDVMICTHSFYLRVLYYIENS